MLSRGSHLERVGRWLARREPELQGRLARELVSTIRGLNRTIAQLDRELEQRTTEVAPALLQLPGCAAVTAAKLLAEIGPVDRFRSDAQLARHSGVAPLEASSGRTQRHRLDRGGNRQLNAALYRIAITQARYHAPARDYLERKRAEGKSRREALRCLKRLLVRAVFNTLKTSPALTYEQRWLRRSRCYFSPTNKVTREPRATSAPGGGLCTTTCPTTRLLGRKSTATGPTPLPCKTRIAFPVLRRWTSGTTRFGAAFDGRNSATPSAPAAAPTTRAPPHRQDENAHVRILSKHRPRPPVTTGRVG